MPFARPRSLCDVAGIPASTMPTLRLIVSLACVAVLALMPGTHADTHVTNKPRIETKNGTLRALLMYTLVQTRFG